jgi:putative ABC transport system permease protein
VHAVIAAIDRDLPVRFARTLRTAVEIDTWFFDVFGGVFVVFGAVALVLAAVGLYAVMAFSVTQRTREVGIRMAIGADARDVRTMILRQGVLQAAIGITVGLVIAAGVARLLAVILFDVDPGDPAVYAIVVAILTTTALLACIVPARRATRIQPLEALRTD